MFATAIRYIGRKPKPKMKPIELKTPPEQTQTITRAIFDIVKDNGPLTIADTWERLQQGKARIDNYKVQILRCIHYFISIHRSWCERTVEQKADENSIEMDEREAED
ncbi:hypothetical protein CsSME_00005882 [Camellia sinensis var. sinensis]